MQHSNILFLCTHNSVRSQMAEGFARAYAPPGVHVFSAGMETSPVDTVAVKIMQEYNIDISSQHPDTIDSVATTHFDLIITLCDKSRHSCPLFPGSPAIVHWEIPSPAEKNPEDKKDKALRTTARTIHDLTFNLFKQGYFRAFLQQKQNTDNILDAISDGIIAFDLTRTIFLFSRGAERVTGFRASEVIGKDSCGVFYPQLFGERCIFDASIDQQLQENDHHYTSFIIDKAGTRKEIDVSVMPLWEDGRRVGAIAILHDNSELNTLRRRVKEEYSFRGIIGHDHSMQQIYELIRDMTEFDYPVCITGETGTGKELVARAIHNESTRKNGPFVPVNCAALPEGTLESELFGHVRGAFTHAIRDKKGRFEIAHTGTLFLDEVAELSTKTQTKLLRVLQEGTFEPVGGEKSITVDVRIISATNKNLREYITRGEFREDLFYRLAVVPIEMPPLRKRRNDILLLARYFLDRERKKLARAPVSLSHRAGSLLISYAWPGNVRQLQNATQFALLKCKSDTIHPHHLPPEIKDTDESGSTESDITYLTPPARKKKQVPKGKRGRHPLLSPQEVKEAIRRSGGNKAKAARSLGIGRATLYNYLKTHPQRFDTQDGD